jgi:hypothetical protein
VPQGVHVVKALNTLDLEDLQGEKNNFRIYAHENWASLLMFSAKVATEL